MQECVKRGPFHPTEQDLSGGFSVTNSQRCYPWWYDKHSWLEYSPSADACFCFPCMLYSDNNTIYPFCTFGVRDWKRDKKFNRHSISATCKSNLNLWESGLKNVQPKVSEMLWNQLLKNWKR